MLQQLDQTAVLFTQCNLKCVLCKQFHIHTKNQVTVIISVPAPPLEYSYYSGSVYWIK
jgi:hypothetical protein